MKIELLNVKIEIQKNSVVTDHHANRKNAWTPFYTRHATVSAEAPKEDSEAGLIIDGSKADFILSVQPGLSGMWQISGRSDTGYEERITLDSYYIQNWSIWLDIWIIIRTIYVVLNGKGAY